MKRALVFSLIFAVGLGVAVSAQTLSGYWETTIILDLTAAAWPAGVEINSEIGIDYTVGDWTFGSVTGVTNGVWDVQDFSFSGVLGAFTLSGAIEFDPTTVAFTELNVETGVSIAGVTFGVEFTLVPNGTELILTGSGVAGDVSIDVEIGLGDQVDCDFDFEYVEIVVGFPFCCADITAELSFTCAGFQYVEFCFDGLTIENLPWLTLGACVRFQTDSKVFTFDPSIDLGVIGCDFDLYYRLDTHGGTNYTPLNIEGIIFDGIQIACEIGGVQFTGITYWGPDVFGAGASSPGILAGYEDYWEAYQIATTDDGCCGPFSFDVTVFFDENGTALFDVAYLVANLEIQIATQFTFGMGLETDVQAGTVNDLTFTFLVEW